MRRTLLILLGAALLAGCGGAKRHDATVTTTARTAPPNPTAELEQGIRDALRANARVSDYVLEHNAIPSFASESTSGPALAGMRGSAAQRKTGHITVRVLSNTVEINAIELDPSYETASARVTERSSVVPYRDGRRLGRAVNADEHGRFELHRVGSGTRFVVWSVAEA